MINVNGFQHNAGLLWDMEKGKIFITEDRIKRLKTTLEFVHLKVMKNKMFFQV